MLNRMIQDTNKISKAEGRIDYYNLSRSFHRLQKSHWQKMEIAKSCRAAARSLGYLLNISGEVEYNEQEDKRVESLQKMDDILDAICQRLEVKEINNKDQEHMNGCVSGLRNLYQSLPQTTHRILFHRIILRLVRSLIRLSIFGECAMHATTNPEAKAQQDKIKQMCWIFLGLGDDLNLGDNPISATTKSLTARYSSARGLQALYEIGKKEEVEPRLKMTYYNHQAQARSIRAGGFTGTVYEANFYVDEAEMLLWRARVSLYNAVTEKNAKSPDELKIAYTDAAARQDAAIRQFGLARARLVTGSTALYSWLELTVIRTAVTADVLKRLTCEYLDIEDQIAAELRPTERAKIRSEMNGTRLKLIGEFAYHTEQASFELGYLLPLLWNDTWRGSRAAMQLFRIAGYICRMTWLIGRFIGEATIKQNDGQSAPILADEALPVIISLNTLIRSVNNFYLGGGVDIRCVPFSPTEDWCKFEYDVWCGLNRWVSHINNWWNRLTSDETKWTDVPTAKQIYVTRKTDLDRVALCYENLSKLSKITDRLPIKKRLDGLKKEFNDTEYKWKEMVRRWPSRYLEPRAPEQTP